MHEWALAESVLESVKVYKNNNPETPLKKVIILMGELQTIDQEVFWDGIETLSGDYDFSKNIFEIKTVKARFACNNCGNTWARDEMQDVSDEQIEAIHFLPEAAHSFIHCAECGSPDFKIIEGRGIAIEYEEEVNNP